MQVLRLIANGNDNAQIAARAPHQPEDGQEPHLEHPDEAPDREPHPGCGVRGALRPRLGLPPHRKVSAASRRIFATMLRVLAAVASVVVLSAGAAQAGSGSLHSRSRARSASPGSTRRRRRRWSSSCDRTDRLRPQRRPVARAGLEREAQRDLRRARRARPLLPLPDRGARRGPPRREHLAGPADPQGLRRPGADLGRPPAPRRASSGARASGGSPAAIVGDASAFDSKRVADGWLPSFEGVESAPLSALVVDRAARERPDRRRSGARRAARVRPPAPRPRDRPARGAFRGRRAPAPCRSRPSTPSRSPRSSSSWTTGATTSPPRWS